MTSSEDRALGIAEMIMDGEGEYTTAFALAGLTLAVLSVGERLTEELTRLTSVIENHWS